MRVGFVTDVHGDLTALERAFANFAGLDAVVFLGDAVGGPQDRACVELVRARATVSICGNHDLDPADVAPLPDELRAWLGARPRTHAGEGFLAVHSRYLERGNYLSYQYVFDESGAQALLEQFPDDLIFIGHSHVPRLQRHHGDQRDNEPITHSRTFVLDQPGRYVCTVGWARSCVVLYDTSTRTLEYRIFERIVDRFARRG